MSTAHHLEPEFRHDAISDEWVIIAPGRGRKPNSFAKSGRTKRKPSAKSTCPFEKIISREEHKIISISGSPDDWSQVVVTNKYPALKPNLKFSSPSGNGLNKYFPATGFHELIITRSHTDNFAHLTPAAAAEVFLTAQDRFRAYAREAFALYGFFFHNWGPLSGASVYHPHYQLMSLPVLPTYIKNSLAGSVGYYRRTGRSAYADLVKSERHHKKRLVVENKSALALVPFAALDPFHIRIFPKTDSAFFEQAAPRLVAGVAELVQDILHRYEAKLKDPDYNFFIHSAPFKNQSRYRHYRWHVDIIPKISAAGGVEVGTAVEVTPLNPDIAAAFLRR